jgi:hypothetical protein
LPSPKPEKSQHIVLRGQSFAVSEHPETPQVWVWNVSQKFASPTQSAELVHAAPSPSNVRQYGWDSQVAQVYAAPQSVLLAQVFVQVPAVPPPRTAQYAYVASVHGALVVLHGSPRPATVTHTLSALLVLPAAQPHFPTLGTSSAAQR